MDENYRVGRKTSNKQTKYNAWIFLLKLHVFILDIINVIDAWSKKNIIDPAYLIFILLSKMDNTEK